MSPNSSVEASDQDRLLVNLPQIESNDTGLQCQGTPERITKSDILGMMVVAPIVFPVLFLSLAPIVAIWILWVPILGCVIVIFVAYAWPYSKLWIVENIIKGSLYLSKPLDTSHDSAIRVLCIKPGASEDRLYCELICTNWLEQDYEALSYTWGEQLRWDISHFIFLDGRPFWVRKNLERALLHHRQPDEARYIWVDAICIDQDDNNDALKEKAYSIPKMNQIYFHARKVVVWLDMDLADQNLRHEVESLFRKLSGSGSMPPEDIHALSLRLSDPEKSALRGLVSLPWWDRLWIIQEVVCGRNVVVQCGNLTLDWPDLCNLIFYPRIGADLQIPEKIVAFVQKISVLRSVHKDNPSGILALVYQFQDSKATIAQDRVFALMNLVNAPEHSLNTAVDYSISDVTFFSKFTKEMISKYQNLNALIGLEADHHDRYDVIREFFEEAYDEASSWLYLWGLQHAKYVRKSLWHGDLIQNPFHVSDAYSAAGSCPGRCRSNLPDPQVISIQGFQIDVITEVGWDYYQHYTSKVKGQLLKQWSDLINCKASSLKEQGQRNQILLTSLTAGKAGETAPILNENLFANPNFHSQIDATASGRRLILTKNGKVGLGHSNCRPGDLICVLLGAGVPYILRYSRHEGFRPLHGTPTHCLERCRRARHLRCCIPRLHRLIGQAYVHEYMWYQGDIEDDIKREKVSLEEYFLE